MSIRSTEPKGYIWEPLRSGRGRAKIIIRSVDRWKTAIAGHRRDAHGGERLEGCQACHEMEAKLKAVSQ